MSDLYVFTIFESDGGRPRCTGVKAGDKIKIYDLFRPGARKIIGTINQHINIIRSLFIRANNKGHRIVTSDFKNHLAAFGLPLELRPYNVYDLHLPDVRPTDTATKDADLIRRVLDKISNYQVKEYQKVLANAAVVYQDLQTRGLSNNYVPVWSVWSQKTFSGRSKTTGFNIQGFVDQHLVLPPGVSDRNVLIHFDWVCADIRVASLLSGDTKLQGAFDNSDPYTYMMELINAQAREPISRDECKIFLLKSINSMDFTSIALTKIYEGLGSWIGRCQKLTREPGGFLETLLGRRFRVAHAKNELAVLNGAMQGSVSHGMQNVLRRVWEKIPYRLITEIHDSLVVCSPPDPAEVRATIATVAPIMLYPFAGLLPDNPVFPLKVSIGKKWRKWKLLAVYRHNRVEYVKTRPTTEETPEGRFTEEEEGQEDVVTSTEGGGPAVGEKEPGDEGE
jgi:hypothetical protein